jgi:hypothetical protein
LDLFVHLTDELAGWYVLKRTLCLLCSSDSHTVYTRSILNFYFLELFWFFYLFESFDFVELSIEGYFGALFEGGKLKIFEEFHLFYDWSRDLFLAQLIISHIDLLSIVIFCNLSTKSLKFYNWIFQIQQKRYEKCSIWEFKLTKRLIDFSYLVRKNHTNLFNFLFGCIYLFFKHQLRFLLTSNSIFLEYFFRNRPFYIQTKWI